MNTIINKFLLAGDKFMPEMHLRRPQFVYSACGPFSRDKERIKESKCAGDMRYIYRNEFDKACFQHDSVYADHKDLINRAKSDKVLRDKAYDIPSNPEYDGYQRGLASMVYKFFDKKSMGSGIANSSILADELHKPVIKKFNKRKIHSQFKDNIRGVDVTTIKNDYVTNASLTSQLNDLKSQHIATEVTGIDNKTKKNASDILALENKLTQKGDTINENKTELSIFKGFFFYLQKNHLVYECKVNSYTFNNKKILK